MSEIRRVNWRLIAALKANPRHQIAQFQPQAIVHLPLYIGLLMNRLTLTLAAGALALIGTQASAAAGCTTPDNVNAMASEIARGLNANRAANGQSQLSFNRRLGRAAMAHACDMSVNGFFGHRGTDGSNSQVRVRAAGYQDCLVAENLAWGYPRSEQIISGWMNSAGHRSNMLHPRAQEYGIGISNGAKGPNWVLVVAKGC